MRRILLLIFLISLNAIAIPKWAENSKRQIEDENISHWGLGIDKNPDVAMFKAQFSAMDSLINECGGYANKDIIITHKHIENNNGLYNAYSRARIPYVSCYYSRTPMAKDNKDLENPQLKKGMKLYYGLIEENFKKKKENKSQDNKKLISKVTSYFNEFKKQTNNRLNKLEKDVESLANKPQEVTIIQKNITMNASETKFRECMEDYDELMREAQHKAMKARIPGNLADPVASRYFNRAQRKLYRCQRMKVK